MEPVALVDKANRATVTLQGDASLEYDEAAMTLESCWPLWAEIPK